MMRSSLNSVLMIIPHTTILFFLYLEFQSTYFWDFFYNSTSECNKVVYDALSTQHNTPSPSNHVLSSHLTMNQLLNAFSVFCVSVKNHNFVIYLLNHITDWLAENLKFPFYNKWHVRMNDFMANDNFMSKCF